MSDADLLPATARTLHHKIATAQVEARTPSLICAVVRDGRPVWVGARGTVDGAAPTADTQYRIGSLTKTFVAVLVMRLRDEGLLALADRLDTHLPGTDVGSATIAQLLSHTAGLGAETPAPWWERTAGQVRPELADALGPDPVRHEAGRRHHYSNVGYAVLGGLVERLRGRPWGEVLRDEVLRPLGMTRTSLLPQAPHAHGWAVHPWADVLLPEPTEDAGRMAPAGQLWSTIDDLAGFAAFLAAGDDRVLSADTIAEMRRPLAPTEDDGWDAGYGLGMQLKQADETILYGHTGSMPGFLANLWVSEPDALAGIVLANTTSGLPVGGLGADLIRIVAEAEPRIPQPWQPLRDVDPTLLELVGPWYWGPTPFAMRLGADGLSLGPVAGGGRATRLRAEPDGTWTGLDGYYAGETMRVVRRADGTVDHLDLASFAFTRTPYDPAADVPGGVDPAGWRGV